MLQDTDFLLFSSSSRLLFLPRIDFDFSGAFLLCTWGIGASRWLYFIYFCSFFYYLLLSQCKGKRFVLAHSLRLFVATICWQYSSDATGTYLSGFYALLYRQQCLHIVFISRGVLGLDFSAGLGSSALLQFVWASPGFAETLPWSDLVFTIDVCESVANLR